MRVLDASVSKICVHAVRRKRYWNFVNEKLSNVYDSGKESPDEAIKITCLHWLHYLSSTCQSQEGFDFSKKQLQTYLGLRPFSVPANYAVLMDLLEAVCKEGDTIICCQSTALFTQNVAGENEGGVRGAKDMHGNTMALMEDISKMEYIGNADSGGPTGAVSMKLREDALKGDSSALCLSDLTTFAYRQVVKMIELAQNLRYVVYKYDEKTCFLVIVSGQMDEYDEVVVKPKYIYKVVYNSDGRLTCSCPFYWDFQRPCIHAMVLNGFKFAVKDFHSTYQKVWESGLMDHYLLHLYKNEKIFFSGPCFHRPLCDVVDDNFIKVVDRNEFHDRCKTLSPIVINLTILTNMNSLSLDESESLFEVASDGDDLSSPAPATSTASYNTEITGGSSLRETRLAIDKIVSSRCAEWFDDTLLTTMASPTDVFQGIIPIEHMIKTSNINNPHQPRVYENGDLEEFLKYVIDFQNAETTSNEIRLAIYDGLVAAFHATLAKFSTVSTRRDVHLGRESNVINQSELKSNEGQRTKRQNPENHEVDKKFK
eukprot:Awhi_evm1s3431